MAIPTIHIFTPTCTCIHTGQCIRTDGITLLLVQADTLELEVGVQVLVALVEAVAMLKALRVAQGHVEVEEGLVLLVVEVLVVEEVGEEEGGGEGGGVGGGGGGVVGGGVVEGGDEAAGGNKALEVINF